MIETLEAIKDTLQVAIDSGTQRIERIHGMVVDYAKQHARETHGEPVVDRKSVYDLVRAINRELGEAATDLFEMVESAQAARGANRDREA